VNQPEGWVTRIFAWLLQLYPKPHQAAYREEMISVFSQAVDDCACQGVGSLFIFGLRELRDFPFNLLKAHLEARKELKMAGVTGGNGVLGMSNPSRFEFPLESWREVVFAVLPYILLPLVDLMSLIDTWIYPLAARPKDFQSPIMSITIFLLIAILVGMMITGLIVWKRKGQRRWISSWMGWGLIYGLGLVLLAMNNLFHIYEFTSPFFIIMLPLFFGGCMLLGLKDRASALLSALGPVLIIMTMFVSEGTHANASGLVYAAVMLLAGGTALVITRWGNWRLGSWLICGILLLGGLVVSIAPVYFNDWEEMGYSYVPSINKVMDGLNTFLIGGGFILVPLILLELGRLAWKGGLFSRTGWMLVTGGLLVVLAGALGWMLSAGSILNTTSHPAVLIGTGGYIVGLLLLVGAARLEKGYPARRGALAVVLLPLILVNSAVKLSAYPSEVVFAFTLAWLMAMCWAVGKINQ
jgi:hypothetical protein